MPNHRPALVLLAVLLGLGAGACGGGGDVSRDSVETKVTEYLMEREASAGGPLSEDDAETAATCVANAIFDDSVEDPITREERNDVGRGLSGDEPDPDLVSRVERILDGCLSDGAR